MQIKLSSERKGIWQCEWDHREVLSLLLNKPFLVIDRTTTALKVKDVGILDPERSL